jgi:hypothetical protein
MMDNMTNNKPNATGSAPVTREQRAAVIADIAARKRAQEEAASGARSLVPGSRPVPPGSRDARRAEATRPGVVTPSKPTRPVKIPAAANLTRVDDTSTVTEGDVRIRATGGADAQAQADAELDAGVAAASKPAKATKDPNLLSVGDVARELGIDPKRARSRLRASGGAAVEGRWPKVRRDSDEHKALIAVLSPPAAATP